jgi:hypothetical protein
MPVGRYMIDHYLDNYEDKVQPTELKGLSGTWNEASFSLLKHEMARVKHSSKFNLTEEQKNMMILPGDFTWSAEERNFTNMTAWWLKYGREKKPWDFNRVFIAGSVTFKLLGTLTLGHHAVLFVMNFGTEPYQIDWYDSAHCDWTRLCKTIREWLQQQGMTGKMVFKAHNEVPKQLDSWNCGQNMLLTARALIRCEKPNYEGYIEPWTETLQSYGNQLFRKYKHGRTNIFGRKSHPGIDSVIEKFSEQKVKDHGRMTKWKTKTMKGFK